MLIKDIILEAHPNQHTYGIKGKPEWYDRAVQMKLNNPRISATEIAKQIGIKNPSSVTYWLAGSEQSRPHLARPMNRFPFKPEDFPRGMSNKKYYDGAKPEWYDQALQMAKAGESFTAIAKKIGASRHNIGNWLVKGRKHKTGKLINPDAELEPRKIIGQKLDINLLYDFIEDDYSDEDIIELVAHDKGPKIANQVKNMLPILRAKQKASVTKDVTVDKTTGQEISNFV